MLIAFHKPHGVISQFTAEIPGQRTLADFGIPKRQFPIGRLDLDSEGLLLLSDESQWNARLLPPERAHRRTYWVQVEGVPTLAALDALQNGIVIQGRRTLPCSARLLDPAPEMAARVPPIRFRKNVPDRWIEIQLIEGKNRQVRKMTAAVGYPTLRLVRVAIGNLRLGDLAPGAWRELSADERTQV